MTIPADPTIDPSDIPRADLERLLRTRRMARLREELEDAGACIPAGSIALLKAIDRARTPRRHERRFASYGSIVTTDYRETVSALDEMGAMRLTAERPAAWRIRTMARLRTVGGVTDDRTDEPVTPNRRLSTRIRPRPVDSSQGHLRETSHLRPCGVDHFGAAAVAVVFAGSTVAGSFDPGDH